MTDIYFEGSQSFRQRIILSTITHKNIQINNIRINNESPGLLAYEISLLRLFNIITDGTKLIVDPTGTRISYKPGILIGIRPELSPFNFNCSNSRSITFFLEALALVAPFCKFPLNIKLGGVTNCNEDLSIDSFKNITIPILKKLGIEEGIQLNILARGSKPKGGGLVHFICPPLKSIKPIKWITTSRIKRIRGVAYTNNVSNHFAIKLVDSIRGVFNNFLSDVWIYNDKCEGSKAGLSPGIGISITAECFDGQVKGADINLDNDFNLSVSKKPFEMDFEDEHINAFGDRISLDMDFKGIELIKQVEMLGKLISWKLLTEIQTQSVVDTAHQYLPLFFMSLADEYEICQIKLSTITPYTIQFLRHLRDFIGTVFEIEKDKEHNTFILKCIGSGMKNLARKAF